MIRLLSLSLLLIGLVACQQSNSFVLSLASAGTGKGSISSEANDINCQNCQKTLAANTSLSLVALPSAGSVFAGWQGDCSGQDSCTVTMSQARTVVAVFNEEGTFAVNVALTGSGSGNVMSNDQSLSCPTICSADFPSSSTVSLTASPSAGSVFAGWQGDCSGQDSCNLSQSANVTAVFNKTSQTTPVSLTLSPQAVSLTPGESISFTATVAGTSDTRVSWAASGGSIDGDGTTISYTAPQAPGSYTLSATSLADTTKTSSANISVGDGSLTESFSIIALPDTQNYVCSGDTGTGCGSPRARWPELFLAQTQWIVDNLDTLNIAFVSHEGDLVDTATRSIEWTDANKAMDLLDSKVPYAAAIGDHDYQVEELRSSGASAFISNFGPSRYTSYSWYGGAAPNELSFYQTFVGGGMEFLHIALEWEAPGPVTDATSALGWAQSILDANPNTPTIITTHAYLNDNPTGHSTALEENDKDGSTGEEIFNDLVKPNPQVFMVLGGHYHKGAGKNQGIDSDDGEFHQVSTNDAGSKVYEMLANYQDYSQGGDGWLRIIEFIPDGGASGLDRIQVKTYSPSRDEFQTSAKSEFFFDLEFSDRF